MKKFKTEKGAKRGALGIALGVFAYLSTLVLFSILAAILSLGADDPIGRTGIYSLIATVLAGATGGIIICRGRGEGGIKHSALCAAATTAVMLILGLVFSGGVPAPSAFINYFSFLGSAILFSYLGRKKEHNRKRRRNR